MQGDVELPVALPALKAFRKVTTTLAAGIKDHHGVGRIERGVSEQWCAGKVWRSAPGCIVVREPGDVVRALAQSGPVLHTVVTLPGDAIARVREQGKGASIKQLDPGDARSAPMHRLLDAVLAGADRLTLEVALAEALHLYATTSDARPEYSRPVRRAVEYIRANLAGSVSLDALAGHADLDKFHLCRAFRAQVGLPPHAYLTHLRVARAKALLRSGMRASEVALVVGFSDQAQLTRHFRRVVGTTPARYRGRKLSG